MEKSNLFNHFLIGRINPFCYYSTEMCIVYFIYFFFLTLMISENLLGVEIRKSIYAVKHVFSWLWINIPFATFDSPVSGQKVNKIRNLY